jgi:hypothetical protein
LSGLPEWPELADSAISGPTAGDRVRLTEIDPLQTFANVHFAVSLQTI